MAIDIQINPDSSQDKATKPEEKQASASLNIRKSLDGNLMIFDHEEIDIVVMPSKNKIVAFAKDELSDATYAAQDRLFYDLSKKGIIQPETVHAGSVYGSMEATISQSYERKIVLRALQILTTRSRQIWAMSHTKKKRALCDTVGSVVLMGCLLFIELKR